MLSKLLHWIFTLIVVIIGLLGLSDCSTRKAATATGEEYTSVTPGASTPSALNARYSSLTSSWKPWRDIEASAKLSLTSPAKFNASTKIYMKRNEWISISVRMLGFEVATIWLDTDSVVAVDKFHKKYISEPTKSLLANASVTISDIQDLLTGRAFLVGSGTLDAATRSRLELSAADNGWYILPLKQPQDYTYGFLASLTANALRGAVVEVPGHGSVSATYSDQFESRTCGWFSQQVEISNSAGKRISATLRWDMNGAKFNSNLSRKPNIPDNCERIPASALSSLLKSF